MFVLVVCLTIECHTLKAFLPRDLLFLKRISKYEICIVVNIIKSVER